MTIIVLIDGSAGLRGHVGRWLVEVRPGVFVGRLSARVRANLWKVVVARVGRAQAVLIAGARNEQGWTVESVGTERWTPADFDGVALFRRPTVGQSGNA